MYPTCISVVYPTCISIVYPMRVSVVFPRCISVVYPMCIIRVSRLCILRVSRLCIIRVSRLCILRVSRLCLQDRASASVSSTINVRKTRRRRSTHSTACGYRTKPSRSASHHSSTAEWLNGWGYVNVYRPQFAECVLVARWRIWAPDGQ